MMNYLRLFKFKFGLMIIAVACCTLVFSAFGCSGNNAIRWTNVIEGYDEYGITDFYMEKGETLKFDLYDKFDDYLTGITDIEAASSNTEVFTVKNGTLTATGMGCALLSVQIYCKNENICYYATAAIIYVTDINDASLIEIKTAEDLADINLNLTGSFILKNDVDLADWGDWMPIGTLPSEEGNTDTFRGTFINPYGYKISNLKISSAENVPHGVYGGCCGGLFGNLQNAYIDGIILENVYIDVTDFNGDGASQAGGIASVYLNSVIRNCRVDGTVKGQEACGGIIGSANWGKISGCSFSGSVTSTKFSAGGIAGRGHIIRDCNCEGIIEGFYAAGGILGEAQYGCSVSGCEFNGKLFSEGRQGEIIAVPYHTF